MALSFQSPLAPLPFPASEGLGWQLRTKTQLLQPPAQDATAAPATPATETPAIATTQPLPPGTEAPAVATTQPAAAPAAAPAAVATTQPAAPAAAVATTQPATAAPVTEAAATTTQPPAPTEAAPVATHPPPPATQAPPVVTTQPPPPHAPSQPPAVEHPPAPIRLPPPPACRGDGRFDQRRSNMKFGDSTPKGDPNNQEILEGPQKKGFIGNQELIMKPYFTTIYHCGLTLGGLVEFPDTYSALKGVCCNKKHWFAKRSYDYVHALVQV